MSKVDKLSDADIARIFENTRTIALVGASPRPERASHRVGQFLVRQGYRVIPVNPGQAGKTLFGEKVVANLSEIPDGVTVDMVDIFRRSEDVPPVVDLALDTLPGLKTVWMQLDIVNAAAADAARDRGVEVVMDRCPAIEIPRLGIKSVA